MLKKLAIALAASAFAVTLAAPVASACPGKKDKQETADKDTKNDKTVAKKAKKTDKKAPKKVAKKDTKK